MDDVLYWLWLADAVGSACPYAGQLLADWPEPAALYAAVQRGGPLPDYLSGHAAGRLRDTSPFDYEERLDHCLLSGIAVVTPDDPDYPGRLRALPDLPLALYATGATACLDGGLYVGMVGTRRPSAYGVQACYDLSAEMARQGAVVVSGLADGLDGVAHRAAVEAGAPTVAFLGTAIDKTFPAANTALRRRIEQGGGCVASEYPPGYPGRAKGTFLARNRLIAGQAHLLCVAEARARSGTLNTVGHAERYGRPVFAVPGSIYSPVSAGTNELLRTGQARALCRAADVLQELGLEGGAGIPPRQEPKPEELSPDAQAVHAALGPQPRTADELCARTGLPTHRVLAALTELELAGAAVPQPGQRYAAAQ